MAVRKTIGFAILFLFVCLIAALCTTISSTADDGQSDEFHGIRVESFNRTVGEPFAHMQIAVRSDISVEHAWTVLHNVGSWDKFIRLFSKTETIETIGERTRVRIMVTPPWPVREFPCLVEAKEVPGTHVIDWNVQEGKLRGNFGRISVEGVNGGSRIIYESNGPSRNAFPTWAVKIGVSIVLPGVLRDFYQRVQEVSAQEKIDAD